VKKEKIFSVDINQNAVDLMKRKGFHCKRSNLFDKISSNHKFDVIVFNPPYLPEDKNDKLKDTSGGKKGNETINLFLKQSKNHLNLKGNIFLLTSSYTPKVNFEGYKKNLLAKKKLFFEELYVWKLGLK
jgi:methylase of polypeptide subunit release factors